METITFGRRSGRAAAEWAVGAHDDRRPRVGRARRGARAAGAARPRRRASGRGRSATSSAPRCSRTSPSSGARSRWRGSSRSSPSCASVTRSVFVEDKGNVFNSDLTQAIELGNMLDTRWLHGHGGARAQGEPRRALAPVRLSRRATTRTSSSTRSRAGSTAAPELSYEAVTDHEVGTGREEVLSAGRPQGLALRVGHRRAGSARVRGRRARGGDAARRPRHRQGQRTTGRSRTARAAG